MADDTRVQEIINLAIKEIDFYYQKLNKHYRFKFTGNKKLLFYEMDQLDELIAA